jgi:hypothetical protein
MYISGGPTSSSNGLSIHFCKSTFTNKFNLIKATRFERYHLYFANAFRINIVIRAVHICIITAFSLVPTNDFMCNNCLMSLKNISICQRLLYSSDIVLQDHVIWFVISSMVC